MNIKISICTICFACFLSFLGCKYKGASFSLNTDVSNCASDSLDLFSLIGREFRVINIIAKQKCLLIKAIKSDASFFIGIDLSEKKVLFVQPDPSKDYISSTFDVNGDSIYSLSSLLTSEIFATSIISGGTKKKSIDFERMTRPGQIFVNQSQIFLVSNVYGVGVVNQRSLNKKMFYNNGLTGLINPQSSTLNIPVSDSMNLISGHVTDSNKIQLYAIDDRDSIKWKYQVKQKSGGEVLSILQICNLFVIKYDSTLVGLNMKDGKEIWRNNLGGAINQIYRWGDKVLTYSLVKDSVMYTKNVDLKHKVLLKLFDAKDGKEIWNKDVFFSNTPQIGICNNKLLVSDDDSFTIFSLANGSLLKKETFLTKDKINYSFETLCDIRTGTYYIRSYDWKFYW